MTIASRLTVFAGSYAPGLRGEICRTDTGLGKRYQGDFTPGENGGFGSRFWSSCSSKPMRRMSLAESFILLMAVSFERINMPLEPSVVKPRKKPWATAKGASAQKSISVVKTVANR